MHVVVCPLYGEMKTFLEEVEEVTQLSNSPSPFSSSFLIPSITTTVQESLALLSWDGTRKLRRISREQEKKGKNGRSSDFSSSLFFLLLSALALPPKAPGQFDSMEDPEPPEGLPTPHISPFPQHI